MGRRALAAVVAATGRTARGERVMTGAGRSQPTRTTTTVSFTNREEKKWEEEEKKKNDKKEKEIMKTFTYPTVGKFTL